MNGQTKPGTKFKITTGDLSGSQFAVGEDITQTQQISHERPEVTPAELAELSQMCANLKRLVEAQAPPDKKADALRCVVELEEAVTAEKPDLTTMGYVKNWFVKNLPSLAGAVTGLVVHPIVGKLVEAAGEMLASELKQHFGGAK
jgi:hypothetical protein